MYITRLGPGICALHGGWDIFLFVGQSVSRGPETCWALSPESSGLGRTSDPDSYAGAGGSDFNSQLFAGFLVSYRPLAFQELTRIRQRRRDLHGIPQFKLALVECSELAQRRRRERARAVDGDAS